jgi:hypothetical protein
VAFRTDQSRVREVLEEADETIPVEPFIRAANAVINSLISRCAAMAASSADELAVVETWLAAHYYAQRDPAYASKTTGGASGTFQGQTAMYFEASKYGQRAMELDGSGCLSKRQWELKTGNTMKASLTWGGKARSDQLTYEERNR